MQWGIFREDEVSRWDWADTGRSSQTKGVGKEGRKGKPTVNYKGAGASANFEQIVFVNFKEARRPNWAKGPSEH